MAVLLLYESLRLNAPLRQERQAKFGLVIVKGREVWRLGSKGYVIHEQAKTNIEY